MSTICHTSKHRLIQYNTTKTYIQHISMYNLTDYLHIHSVCIIEGIWLCIYLEIINFWWQWWMKKSKNSGKKSILREQRNQNKDMKIADSVLLSLYIYWAFTLNKWTMTNEKVYVYWINFPFVLAISVYRDYCEVQINVHTSRYYYNLT